MIQVTFTLRTITPLFLAGANPQVAELRSPSFRGVMRYWQRALVGGLVGTESQGLTEVAAKEEKVFGSTQVSSAFTLRVSAPSQVAREFTEPTSRRVGDKRLATGKGYLLWSMAKSGNSNKGNVKPARWYFPAGTDFQVTLSARNDNEVQFKQAIASFWLLTQLGSLGSRARRCAGSLAIQSVSRVIPDTPTFMQSESAMELKTHLEQGVKISRALYTNELKSTLVRQASFDALAQNVCRIWILQDERPWSDAEMAMTQLGERLQSYRGGIDIERRRIFGLPLPPKFFKERRASPLLLRIVELQGNKYVGIAVLFKTGGNNVNVGDYRIIEEWVNGFSKKLEVML